MGQLPRWLEGQGRFDTAFMFYVLHHSDEYWAAHTLRALRKRIETGGRLVVVEDALVVDAPPKSDPFGLIGQWKSWSTTEPLYCSRQPLILRRSWTSSLYNCWPASPTCTCLVIIGRRWLGSHFLKRLVSRLSSRRTSAFLRAGISTFHKLYSSWRQRMIAQAGSS